MKLTSWAICSLALAAGVLGADRPELFKSLPRCTISCLEKYDNSDFEAVDMCNNGNVKQELDDCFADKCRDFERFDIAKIYANACDSKPKDNRHNHYVLDQPPATDNRRDQYAGNTVSRYEDAEAESMSEGVVRDLGKGTAEETSRVELTAGRQNLRKRQNRDSRRPEVFHDLPIDGHDWYPGPNEDD
ncbi:hypothetical protein FOVSG1_000599 [Fusarium oxysporum f. sp. vasinfectum]